MTNEIIEKLYIIFDENKDIPNLSAWYKITDILIKSMGRVSIDNDITYKLTKLIDDDKFTNLALGKVELNGIIKETMLNDIQLIKINHFYPSIIKQLIESDILIDDENLNNIFLIIYDLIYMTNMDYNPNKLEVIKFYKTWINYSYVAYMSRTSKFNNRIDITLYARDILTKITNELNWVYIDTDMIFCYESDTTLLDGLFDKFNLSYTVTQISYVYFQKQKKYVYLDNNNNMVIKGIRQGEELYIVGELEIIQRDNTINKILENN